ncbi:Chaperone SurA [bioreactor metagenome]|uniref:Chaperone SurA n=1 Tax=bioreactor metagenome TaxID=1076179 RepID=A0A645H3P8_9ZZZZ
MHLYALFLSSDRDDLAAITDKINGILAADSSQFRDLAGTYSDGPFRSRGGDLGWLERSQLRELFSDALKANPDAGSTIGPLTAPEGVYFIQAVEVKPAETATYEGSELDIRAKLELEQRKKVYDNYMKTLRDKAVIRYY